MSEVEDLEKRLGKAVGQVQTAVILGAIQRVAHGQTQIQNDIREIKQTADAIHGHVAMINQHLKRLRSPQKSRLGLGLVLGTAFGAAAMATWFYKDAILDKLHENQSVSHAICNVIPTSRHCM